MQSARVNQTKLSQGVITVLANGCLVQKLDHMSHSGAPNGLHFQPARQTVLEVNICVMCNLNLKPSHHNERILNICVMF